jgi:hypothetical protein
MPTKRYGYWWRDEPAALLPLWTGVEMCLSHANQANPSMPGFICTRPAMHGGRHCYAPSGYLIAVWGDGSVL